MRNLHEVFAIFESAVEEGCIKHGDSQFKNSFVRRYIRAIREIARQSVVTFEAAMRMPPETIMGTSAKAAFRHLTRWMERHGLPHPVFTDAYWTERRAANWVVQEMPKAGATGAKVQTERF